MKVIKIFLLLVVFAVGLSGCARYRWWYTFPPGGTQADFNRDMAYCNDYTRTWCATNGTVVVSGNRQDYQWGQRTVNISGNRSCGPQEFDNIRNDCLGMKGYTYTLVKEGQEKETLSIKQERQPERRDEIQSERKASNSPEIYDKKIVTVTQDFVYIRMGPGNDSPAVMSLNKGCKLTVIDEYGEWLTVRSLESGKQGWISKRAVE